MKKIIFFLFLLLMATSAFSQIRYVRPEQREIANTAINYSNTFTPDSNFYDVSKDNINLRQLLTINSVTPDRLKNINLIAGTNIIITPDKLNNRIIIDSNATSDGNGLSEADVNAIGDQRYVNITGDTMTGDLKVNNGSQDVFETAISTTTTYIRNIFQVIRGSSPFRFFKIDADNKTLSFDNVGAWTLSAPAGLLITGGNWLFQTNILPSGTTIDIGANGTPFDDGYINNIHSKTVQATQDINAPKLNAQDINTGSGFIFNNETIYSIIDLNRSAVASCGGDINSVLNSVGDCVNITGFDVDTVGAGGSGEPYHAGLYINLNNTPDTNTFDFNETEWTSTSHTYSADQNFSILTKINFIDSNASISSGANGYINTTVRNGYRYILSPDQRYLLIIFDTGDENTGQYQWDRLGNQLDFFSDLNATQKIILGKEENYIKQTNGVNQVYGKTNYNSDLNITSSDGAYTAQFTMGTDGNLTLTVGPK